MVPKYCSCDALDSPQLKKCRLSYFPTTNCTPHTHFLVMKWDLMYYVGIFSVPMMRVLGIDKTTKTKSGFVAHERKSWIDSSIFDRL
jgi:hypothetical protein